MTELLQWDVDRATAALRDVLFDLTATPRH